MSDLVKIRGTMVKLGRECRGLSVAQLSKETGIPARRISQWEETWLDGVEVGEQEVQALSEAIEFLPKFFMQIFEPWPAKAVCCGL